MRAQLTLWNIAVVGIALTLFGIALRFGVDRVLVSSVDRTLARQMSRAQQHLRPGPPRPRTDGGEPGGPPPRADGSFDPGGPPEQDDIHPDHPPFDEMGGPDGGPGSGRPRFPRPDGDSLMPRLLMPGSADTGIAGRAPVVPWSAPAYTRALRKDEESHADVTTPEGETIRVYSVPVRVADGRGGTRSAVLQVAAPSGFIQAADNGVTLTLLLLIPAAVLLTGFGGALLTDRALRPIDQLGTRLGRIQAQDLKQRLPDAGTDEFGRLTGTVNDMLARLDDAFERQRRFAADASHELRTPLATIRAGSSLALEPGADFSTEQYRSILERIDSAADRATRVTQDLLFLARVGVLPIRRAPVLLSGILEEAKSAVLAAAPASRKLAMIHVQETDLRLDSDRDHLLRLFINLIDNAVRHTPETGRVDVTARSQGPGAAVIRIADTGEGIAAEHLARIREPFYRPDSARSRRGGGAGLGLAIAQGIVDALGGAMTITSVVGEGTAVSVSLPPPAR